MLMSDNGHLRAICDDCKENKALMICEIWSCSLVMLDLRLSKQGQMSRVMWRKGLFLFEFTFLFFLFSFFYFLFFY